MVLLLCACSGDNESNTEKSEIVLISEAIQKDPSNTILLFDRANYNKALNNLESALFDLNQYHTYHKNL